MKVISIRYIKPMKEIAFVFPDYADKDWLGVVYNDDTPQNNVAIFPCNRMFQNFLRKYNLKVEDVKDKFIRAEAVPYHPIHAPIDYKV